MSEPNGRACHFYTNATSEAPELSRYRAEGCLDFFPTRRDFWLFIRALFFSVVYAECTGATPARLTITMYISVVFVQVITFKIERRNRLYEEKQ